MPPRYDVGEVIFIKAVPTADGNPTKTKPKYREPMVVSKILPKYNYIVTNLEEKEGLNNVTTALVSRIKGWASNTEPNLNLATI